LEQPPQFKRSGEPWLGLLLAFIFGGIMDFVTWATSKYVIYPSVAPNYWVAWVFTTPLLEIILWGLVVLIVSYIVWGMVPNRRYGFVMGAMAGLGYGVFETVFLIAVGEQDPAFYFFMLPIVEMILATFVGIAVFAYVAKITGGENFIISLKGVPLLFFIVSWIFITFFWGIDAACPTEYYWVPYLLLPVYLFCLRDFLGGHFNFQHFFEPLPELSLSSFPEPLPPPPP
jgi:hypothetical protein